MLHAMPAILFHCIKIFDYVVCMCVTSICKVLVLTLLCLIGGQHIDTAQMYGNEAQIGEALAEALKAGTVKREELFITTKLNSESHARESVEPALRESLRKLQLGGWLVHAPVLAYM